MARDSKIENLCARWNVSVERYGWSPDDVLRETEDTFNGITRISAMSQALAIYGELGVVGRVLLFVVSPTVIRSCYDEVLEACVAEICEKLADEFRRDMREFSAIMTFETMNQLLGNETGKPTKRFG